QVFNCKPDPASGRSPSVSSSDCTQLSDRNHGISVFLPGSFSGTVFDRPYTFSLLWPVQLSPSGQSGDGSYRVPEDKFPSDERKQRQIFLYYPELYSSDYCLRLHLLYRPPLAGALYCQHYGSFLYGCNRRNRQSQTKRRTAHAGTAF